MSTKKDLVAERAGLGETGSATETRERRRGREGADREGEDRQKEGRAAFGGEHASTGQPLALDAAEQVSSHGILIEFSGPHPLKMTRAPPPPPPPPRPAAQRCACCIERSVTRFLCIQLVRVPCARGMAHSKLRPNVCHLFILAAGLGAAWFARGPLERPHATPRFTDCGGTNAETR